MEIKGFIENSLLEWEGKIAAVVFLPGCNFRCPYCHAGHLVINPDARESIPLEQVLAALQRHRGWLDGVVISGGEPTLHGEELVELVERFRAIPLRVMIETNGTRPEWLGRLMRDGLIDAASMDVKAPLTSEDYRRVVGAEADIEDVRASVRLLIEGGIEHEFRITLVPGLVGEEELRRIGPELRGAAQIASRTSRPSSAWTARCRASGPMTPSMNSCAPSRAA